MRRARFAGSVADFHAATRPGALDRLVRVLHRGFLPSRWDTGGEAGSWARSLPALADLLAEAGLQRAWVVLEYNPFQAGGSRADAIVIGVGVDARPTYLVVELKQWQAADWDVQQQRVAGTGSRYERARELRHPYDQARDYGRFIRNFTKGMHDEAAVRIESAAYLHNATETSIAALRSAGEQHGAFTFSGDGVGRQRFLGLLHRLFDPTVDGCGAKDRLLDATYQQGPKLLEAAAVIFNDRDRYPLTDEQHNVFGQIQNAVSNAMRVTADRNSAVIVVRGGPGTGKTWIAMHLLGANAHARRQISYATNSSSLREALRRSADFRTLFGVGMADKLITSARTY